MLCGRNQQVLWHSGQGEGHFRFVLGGIIKRKGGELRLIKCLLCAQHCSGSHFPPPSSSVPFSSSFHSLLLPPFSSPSISFSLYPLYYLYLLIFLISPSFSLYSFPVDHLLLSLSSLLFFIIPFHQLMQYALPGFGLAC